MIWHSYCINTYYNKRAYELKNIMEKIRKFMIRFPLLSMLILFPICLIIITGIMSLLIKFVFPIILAFWLSSMVYTAILGKSVNEFYSRPFWFIRYR